MAAGANPPLFEVHKNLCRGPVPFARDQYRSINQYDVDGVLPLTRIEDEGIPGNAVGCPLCIVDEKGPVFIESESPAAAVLLAIAAVFVAVLCGHLPGSHEQLAVLALIVGTGIVFRSALLLEQGAAHHQTAEGEE